MDKEIFYVYILEFKCPYSKTLDPRWCRYAVLYVGIYAQLLYVVLV